MPKREKCRFYAKIDDFAVAPCQNGECVFQKGTRLFHMRNTCSFHFEQRKKVNGSR